MDSGIHHSTHGYYSRYADGGSPGNLVSGITRICRPPHSPHVSTHKGQIGAAIQLEIAGSNRVLQVVTEKNLPVS